ncbi:MAG: hypothetical protein G01um101448_697 [Parcubacteria group bacterium Gr01-1014_48]|nr:MAG: hypothetical protein G01um101448_697 [Parcubacteria group bacterium Gr01-1014_48]
MNFIHVVGQFCRAFRAESGLVFAQKPLELFVDCVGNKCNADVCFNASPPVVEYWSYAQVGLGNTRRALNLPKMTIVFHDFLNGQVRVCYVPLEPIPVLVILHFDLVD